jgi:transcriptional regulator with XRE-family HTH domain
MTDQEFLNRVGAKIAEIRKAKGMSQLDVCSKLNFEKTYLSAIENGRQNITLLTCKQIAEALDVDIRELLEHTKS